MGDQPESTFAFAVQAAPARHGRDWARLARDAEDIGYRALLVPDHHDSGGPLVGIALAGAATTSLRVGTLMLAVDFQQPVVLARELVTLDAMLGGRLEIGLGAGWMRQDYLSAGIHMESAGTRIERLREFAATIRALWAEASIDHDGSHYRFLGAELAPRPHTSSPTLVLGGGGQRMLDVAVELADIVNVGATMIADSKRVPLGESASESAFVRRSEWLEQATHRHGRRPRVQCLAYATRLTSDAHGYVEQHVCPAFGLSAEEVARTPLALVGTVDELCEKIQRLRESLAISYWVVKDSAMHDFAPIVDRLADR